MVLRTIGREDDEAQRATIELALAFVDGCYESPSSTEVRDDPEQRALQEVPRTDSPVETISDQVQLDELSSEDLAALSTFVDEAASEPAASDVLPALTPPPPEQAQRHEQVIPVEGVQRKQPRKIRWDPNKARNQRKAELIYLRRQVLDLETQLTTMKGKKPKLTVVDPQLLDVDFRPSPSAPPDALDTTSVVASAWHDIAMRQGERRVKSERENVRLKLVLENQLKIAKSLETFLVRKTATKAVSAVQSNGPSENPYGNAHVVVCFACGNSQEVDLLPAPRKHLYHVYPATKDNRTDAEIFEDLSIGLDASYAELDALYETTGLAHMERPHFSAQIHCDGRISMYLELFANKVLPFDLHSTGNAVWHHFLHAKERTPSRQYYYDSPKVRLFLSATRCAKVLMTGALRPLDLARRLWMQQKTRLSRASTCCFPQRVRAQISASTKSVGATLSTIGL